DETIVRVPGKCCPQCSSRSCSASGQVYEHGEQWSENACTTCICDEGEVRCHKQACPPLRCDKGQSRAQRHGECCEECVSPVGSCSHNGIVRYQDEMWKSSACEFCVCDHGQVICQTGECAKVECAQGEELIHLDGKCCPECISKNGYCVDEENAEFVTCHSSCLTCVGPEPSHCAQCKKPDEGLQVEQLSGVNITSGKCLSQCRAHFYLENTGLCEACHPSCFRCAGKSPQNCTACWPSQVLLDGQCLSQCPDSYFNQEGSCTECHPTCRQCHGPSESDCSSCHPHVTLAGGSCRTSCKEEQFLNLVGYCTECDWSCNACSGPLRTDCLQCMDGYVLQDGACVEQCSPSFYRDLGLCKSCSNHCVQCQGPHECTRCEEPYLLLEAQCVQECGKGYFADHANRQCTACPRACLRCSRRDWCHQCDHGFFLKSGLCVSNCIPGFSARSNETCTGKIYTPSLHVNGSLTLAIGSMKPLDFPLLNVQDQDGRVEDLQFHVVSTPTNGQLMLSRNGKEVQLDKAGHFSWKDVNEKKVHFVHSKEKPRKGYFSLKVSDQQFFSEPQLINIQAFSIQAPYVLRNEALRISRGERGTITTQLLDIRDDDNPQDVVVQVLGPPLHGQLLQTLQSPATPIYQFRLDELSRGLLHYAHDGSESVSDVAVLQANDGHFFRSILFHVKMVPKNDAGLRLVANSMVWVPEGGMLQITNRILQAEAPGASASEIIYKITQDHPQFVSDGAHTSPEMVLTIHLLPTDQHLPAFRVTAPLLEVSPGGSTAIGLQLAARDTEIAPEELFFELRKPPEHGVLLKYTAEFQGPMATGDTFTYEDIEKNVLQYLHDGSPAREDSMEISVTDGTSTTTVEVKVAVSLSEAQGPQLAAGASRSITVARKSTAVITRSHLAYVVSSYLCLLVHCVQISSFTQADLTSQNVRYIHSSETEKHSDAFSFALSDGVSEVTQTFHITIRPVDDSLPVVQNLGMRVQEGVRKTITEFELKAVDADTEAESVTFTVVQPPRHGTIERASRGQHFRRTSIFTMEDIYQNRVSYSHDGSNSLRDRFTFTVADGTNPFFIVEEGGKEVMTAAPQHFQVDILPVDDGTPRIVTNLGLQWLEYMDGKATNLITKKELLTMDPDTEDQHLVYEITAGPKHGHMENKLQPGRATVTFTQEDVNLGLIRYVLHKEKIHEMMDSFQFLVKDSKPNVVSDNVFHVQWSLISFKYTSYNVSEKAGSVSVTVQRSGNLNQYAIVLCRTEQGTASSSSRVSSQPGQQDYVEYAGQVQFDEREDTKSCTIVINDDDVFENIESFTVELSMPAYALLGEFTQAKVIINDTEDEPTLEFDKKTYRVNESAGFLFAPIERKGDSSSIVSAICYTVPKSAMGSSLYALESGSDFKSRGMSPDSRVIFGPGVTMSTCDVMLIDDSEYEEEEEFEIVLADASDNARIGRVASAKVLISGPNDASTVSLGNTAFTVSEDAGTVKIPVIRHGTDLSTFTSVWCATRPSDPASATPGVDYVPSSRKVEFGPGVTEQYCTLTILDDTQYPVIEGLETFVVFLSSAQGAELTKPFQAVIAINDTFQDVPSMQFAKDLLLVKEKEGVLQVPIIRSGDLSYESSVRCYTQGHSAQVMEDFEERRNADSSRITFLKGEKMKNCTVSIHDDSMFEPEEQFRVYLGHPLGNHWSGARIGKNNMATITISNDEDAPTIEFEEAAYQVREPSGPDAIALLNIKVIRRGDQNRTSKIRCSTRDGSAQSGVDYYPMSRVLKFSPGVDHIFFKVEILSNEDREWHESFSLVLGPDDPMEAVLGDVTTATVTILDQEAAGSLILPAPPIVVTLADYDHVEEVTKEGVKKSPSPGYPLVCVTPCDSHFPKYTIMKERCSEAGINQTSVQFSWEVATPTDGNGARSPFETITDNTPFTSVNHMVLDSIYFSRRFHVRCVAKAVDKVGHVGTPLRSNIVTIGTDSAICHTPVVAGTARGFQAQSFIATLKYLDVKHKEHPNRSGRWCLPPSPDTHVYPFQSIIIIHFLSVPVVDGQFVMEHHTLPDVKSFILTPDHLGGIEFDLQLLWSAQTFDSPYQLWRATSSYNRKDYSGEYTIYLIPCTVQPTQPWVDPGEKPLACTAHAPERFLIPIAFQQTNRPVPVVYSLNTEFQLCNNEKVFLMDPNTSDMSLAEMDYKGAFSKGQNLYGRVLWNPEQNLNSAYKLQLEKVYLCTGKDGYVPFFDPTGTIYNEGPQYGCIQPNKHLKHRFLLLDRSQPEVTDKYFHDVPFEAHFASELPDFHVVSSMPGVDGFTLKVDALYKVEAGHQWYLQVIYIIGPDTISGPRVQRSLTAPLRRHRRDLVDPSGRLTLDDSLIYDNEGDQVKNGTNMKSLNLDMQEPVVAASLSQTGASIGSALAAVMLLLLGLLVACFLTRKCQKQRKKPPTEDILEEYPLNTKVDVSKRSPDRMEKNLNRHYCTVRNVNVLSDAEGAYAFKGAKVKKLNLEVRVHNNLQDGTEV
ncbi:extracellular matrix protein FRAS1, partial [Leptonychotes weddellii]|uniref:Extracellular matrix protein FRAS1 n=1 Tax=Leptonychotes weddellii TaxID=9713 RepID=A0A7F8Q4F1_LEPWE